MAAGASGCGKTVPLSGTAPSTVAHCPRVPTELATPDDVTMKITRSRASQRHRSLLAFALDSSPFTRSDDTGPDLTPRTTPDFIGKRSVGTGDRNC
jgi:hypothetical protein